MGMFDTLVAECPNEDCDGRLELQTKAGPCILKDYPVYSAPMRILIAEEGEIMRCSKCSSGRTLKLAEPLRPRVVLE